MICFNSNLINLEKLNMYNFLNNKIKVFQSFNRRNVYKVIFEIVSIFKEPANKLRT